MGYRGVRRWRAGSLYVELLAFLLAEDFLVRRIGGVTLLRQLTAECLLARLPSLFQFRELQRAIESVDPRLDILAGLVGLCWRARTCLIRLRRRYPSARCGFGHIDCLPGLRRIFEVDGGLQLNALRHVLDDLKERHLAAVHLEMLKAVVPWPYFVESVAMLPDLRHCPYFDDRPFRALDPAHRIAVRQLLRPRRLIAILVGLVRDEGAVAVGVIECVALVDCARPDTRPAGERDKIG